MSTLLIVLLSIGICLTSAQWMQYLEPQSMSPFAQQLSSHLVVPKDTSTKIPIILLLKPKRAKSLTADTNTETIEKQREDNQPLTINEWMGMPRISDSLVNTETHLNQEMSESNYQLNIEPVQEASEDDQVAIKSRGGEQVKWSALKDKSSGVTAEQLASISHLFPKLAAMSAPNTDLTDISEKSSGTLFEDALKRFTSNLTDFEHKNSDANDKKSEDESEEESENSSQTSTDTQNSSGIAEALKSDEREIIDSKEDISEQRNIQHLPSFQKSKPLSNERNRIKIAVKSEPKSNPVIQSEPIQKGWIPIKFKPKPKRKPTKPSISIETQQIHFPSEPSPVSGHYLYENYERQPFGMPERLNSASGEMQSHIFRPRHFPHSYIPYDTKHSISHLPFHKYSSYLTEAEITPALMEMTADANKPQHIEPHKMGEEGGVGTVGALTGDKAKDVIEQKEGMIDNKHVIGEKHVIVEEKLPMHGIGGDDVLDQHLTCCDLLHGHNTGPHHHVIHEEVIKPDFDDDKLISNIGLQDYGHKHGFPLHYGSKFGPYFHQPVYHKKECHHSQPTYSPNYSTTYYPPTHWSPPIHRRPVYRPKLFYKPLLFG